MLMVPEGDYKSPIDVNTPGVVAIPESEILRPSSFQRSRAEVVAQEIWHDRIQSQRTGTGESDLFLPDDRLVLEPLLRHTFGDLLLQFLALRSRGFQLGLQLFLAVAGRIHLSRQLALA